MSQDYTGDAGHDTGDTGHDAGDAGHDTGGGNTDTGQTNFVTKEIQSSSIVNIVNSNGNKYVFNGETTYDSNTKWTLSNGQYVFKNVPKEHPMAILNINESNITYSGHNNSQTPIIIKVSGGNTTPYANGDYYIFKDNGNNTINFGNNGFKFMRGKTYKFIADNIGSIHPFKIYMSGSFQNNNINNVDKSIVNNNEFIQITIPNNHSVNVGDFYYQCGEHGGMKKNLNLLHKNISEGTSTDGTYDFYYGDINVNVTGAFQTLSVYCYYHGFMG